MRTEIRRIQKELNITSVYVTHDQIEAMTLSDRIVVMNEGVIEQIGNPMEIYRYPNSRFVANFIGRANFIDGVILDQNGSALTVQSLGESITLSNVKREFHKGEEVTLIVRPEMIEIKKTGGLYTGVVRRAVYLGDLIEYAVEINGLSILGTETDPRVTELFPDGEQVTIGFAEDCIQVLPAEKKS
jgi:iron(III) transport system ATP-binding protein